MRRAKLTLSVDEDVVRRAKVHAARRGTSVSKLVEDYLSLLTAARKRRGRLPGATPILDQLRGSLKGADISAYLEHLEEKYR